MAFTAPITITTPFCATGDKVIPPAASSPSVANQADGYPISQANTISNLGIPVKRLETNGVLNLYTQHILWKEVGGQYTFDPIIATAGGYNKGAILAYYDGSTNFQGFLYSTKDSNTDNFITTPSFIGTSWIQTVVAQLPDVIDNPTTGNVTIGGRINGATNIIQSFSSANILRQSRLRTYQEVSGYMTSIMESYNGNAGNQGYIKSTYAEGGDLSYKPMIDLRVSLPSGWNSSMTMTASSSSNSYQGFQTVIENYSSNNTSCDLVMTPDSSNNVVGSLYLSNSGVQNTGISFSLNRRATFIGNLATLTAGIASNSPILFRDCQAGQTGVGPNGSSQVTLPVTMPSVNYSISLCVVNSAAPTSPWQYIINNASQFTIYNYSAASLQFAWIVVWRGI